MLATTASSALQEIPADERPSGASEPAARTIEIAVINLKRAEERRKYITRQFADLKVPWSFFEAHTSLANPALQYDEADYRHRFGEPMSSPQLAVWSSHYSVIQKFLLESQSDYLVVFEDDVIFDIAFPLRKLVALCQERQFHYVRLFGMINADAVNLNCFFDRWIIRYKSGPCGAQAYLLSKEGARRMVDTLRLVDCPVDVAMDRFWKTRLPIYSVFPYPVIERFSPSTIPIPDARAPSRSDRAARYVAKLRNKVGKVAANLRLAGRDRWMKQTGWAFKQVDESDLG
jgi:glycosyl transferase, family 25